ncbi:MAG TPA: hypothetical protein VFG49_17460 [Dyella sp.]|uniref:hypothetical protein n=1 Tax=Dyella sp. TaxID=1869338 RepID=UPI002D77AF91|nr:hypothetical protein [Dyella sp.]HET6555318.1 hypothetical protein [Dyella sp.]
MSNLVAFLEKMGTDARLRHASQDELAQALANTQIDASVGAAIIARSTSEVYALMGLRPMFHTLENPGPPPGVQEEGAEVPVPLKADS